MCVKQDILATLSYFDIFDYPINQTEIFQFLKNNCSFAELADALQELSAENWIYKFDEFFTLQNNYALVVRRRKGNIEARKMLKTAEKIASFLSGFPFVRGVAVSGSLSKNFANEDSDIDFFIITEKNKMWLARTLLHSFKKLTYIFKKQHWFCMNYFVDEAMLEIKEKNIYTATEIATLLPFRGIRTFQHFYAENKWSMDFLPNHSMKVSYVEEARTPFFKRMAEFILGNPAGDLLDYSLMKLTAFRWAAKTKNRKLNRRGIVMSMDLSRHYAKPDPGNFQNKLVREYREKILALFRSYENRAKSIY